MGSYAGCRNPESLIAGDKRGRGWESGVRGQGQGAGGRGQSRLEAKITAKTNREPSTPSSYPNLYLRLPSALSTPQASPSPHGKPLFTDGYQEASRYQAVKVDRQRQRESHCTLVFTLILPSSCRSTPSTPQASPSPHATALLTDGYQEASRFQSRLRQRLRQRQREEPSTLSLPLILPFSSCIRPFNPTSIAITSQETPFRDHLGTAPVSEQIKAKIPAGRRKSSSSASSSP